MMILESNFIDYSRENDSGDGLVFWQCVNLWGSFKRQLCPCTGLVKVWPQNRFVCTKTAPQNDGPGNRDMHERNKRKTGRERVLFPQNDSCQYVENAMLKNISFVSKIFWEIHLIIKFCFQCIQYRYSQKQNLNLPNTSKLFVITSPRRLCSQSWMFICLFNTFQQLQAVRRYIFSFLTELRQHPSGFLCLLRLKTSPDWTNW